MVGNIISILLFFIISIGFGHSALLLFKIKIEDIFERVVMKCAIGLSVLLVLGVFLNLIRVPLYWWGFLILSLLGPIYSLYKKQIKFSFPKSVKKSTIFALIILLLFVCNLYMYQKGAFSYPWLYNVDPNTHMMGAKYISI